MEWQNTLCTAFEGSRQIASGALKDVAFAAKTVVDAGAGQPQPLPVLIFNDANSEVIELDWRGSTAEFAARFELVARAMAATATATEAQQTTEPDGGEPPEISPTALSPDSPVPPRGPGRPRLGVVAREVTLLPRHWEWLASQPGGASVALRKLVEVARRTSEVKDRVRRTSEVGYKFMSTMAGHEAGFEEASRALFAGDQAGFEAHIATWPADVQTHLKKILSDAFWWF
jgi:uncharacterized protein